MDVENGKHVTTSCHIWWTLFHDCCRYAKIAILSVFLIQSQCFQSLLTLIPFYIARYRYLKAGYLRYRKCRQTFPCFISTRGNKTLS